MPLLRETSTCTIPRGKVGAIHCTIPEEMSNKASTITVPKRHLYNASKCPMNPLPLIKTVLPPSTLPSIGNNEFTRGTFTY